MLPPITYQTTVFSHFNVVDFSFLPYELTYDWHLCI